MSPVTTQTTTANVLFDEGAQRSFISQELADDLQLPITTYEKVQLSTFGGQSSSRQCPLVAINVLDEQGEPIRLYALVVPEIASLVQHRPSTALISGCLRNLRLAHSVVSSQWFTVSLLIGADFYWHFVGNDIIRFTNGPTAVSSRLSWARPTTVHPYANTGCDISTLLHPRTSTGCDAARTFLVTGNAWD